MAERVRAWVEEVFDATGIGWRTLWVACACLGVALGVLYWLTRPAPVPVDASLPLVEPETVTTTTAPPPAPEPVVVHVDGQVHHPGVWELPADARIIDAIDAAGGLTPDADTGRVNLAAPAVDGSQIYVPAPDETPPAPAADGDPADGGTGASPVNLNSAGATELEGLPGVGPATAGAIIDHRDRHGPFATVDELLLVRGIGEAKLAELRDHVQV